MKYAIADFTLEQSHELKVCGTSKFTGITLEVLLDGRSLFVENNTKRYHVFEVPVEDTAITLYVKTAASGEPEIALFKDGVSMVDGKSYEEFLAEAKGECKKESKLQLLRNLLLQLLLFGAVAFLAKWIGTGFKTDAGTLKTCGMWALMIGGGLSLLFMIFDLVEGKGNLKSLTKSGAAPTSLATEAEDELLEEIDETVDPDEIVVSDDAPNFFDVADELEDAAETAEEVKEVAEEVKETVEEATEE